MIHQVIKHVEWVPQADGRVWWAVVDGRKYGHVIRVSGGRYQARCKGNRNARYFGDIHSAGRCVVAAANYCYPGQLPR